MDLFTRLAEAELEKEEMWPGQRPHIEDMDVPDKELSVYAPLGGLKLMSLTCSCHVANFEGVINLFLSCSCGLGIKTCCMFLTCSCFACGLFAICGFLCSCISCVLVEIA